MPTPLIFRLLLGCYPPAFRKANRDELVAFWTAQAREDRYSGAAGRLRLAAHLARDAALGGLAMRWRTLRQSSNPDLPGRWRVASLAEGFTADLRYAVRSVRGAPTFALMTVVTLALGIGAATAVFSVVETVVLKPLPYPAADRLVQVPRTLVAGDTREASWPDFRDWREQAAPYLDLAASVETDATFVWDGGAESINGALVTDDYFRVIGVPPLLGRGFTADEDRINGADAVVLSHSLWQERFDGDPDVLGRLAPLDTGPAPVVGVMPPGFDAPETGTRFWAPLQEEELLDRVGLPKGSRSIGYLDVIGRLRDHVARDVAEERLVTLAGRIAEEAEIPADRRRSPALVPMLDDLIGDVRWMLYTILGAAGLVLLVAAMNVAALAFSRATMRDHELALRAALGAHRGRLVRQLITESALLSAAAGAAGIAVARALQILLVQLAPAEIPRLDSLGLDAGTQAFAVAVTVAGGLAFGLVPAIFASRSSLTPALAAGRRTSASRASLGPQRLLVSLQVAVSIVLLIGAALLVNSFARLMRVDLGFESSQVIVAAISPGDTRYDTPAAIDAFYAEVLEAVRSMPGVAAVSTTNAPPLFANEFLTTVVAQGEEEDRSNRIWAGAVVIRDDYFDANGVPLLSGRAFDGSDRLGQPLVAIVNESMSERLWPGEDPINKQFRLTGGVSGGAGSFDPAFFPSAPYTVVGVASDIRRISLDDSPVPEYYRPHAQITWAFQYLVLRVNGPADVVAGSIRDAVWSVDPAVPVRSVDMLDAQVRDAAAAPRFRMVLLAGFAGLTGLLAMVGLYAVMTLAVTRRTREMSIRMALGARRAVVVRGVLADGLRLVALGSVAGLVLAWFASRALAAMLFEVSPNDPMTYAGVTALAAVVATLACYGPARRAGRVDPMRSLQTD